MLIFFIISALICLLLCGCTFLASRGHYRKFRVSSHSGLAHQVELSKKELELVFDSIPEQICVLDRDLTVLRANKSYADSVMLQIRDILGNRCHHLLWCNEKPCDECPVLLTFKTGAPIFKSMYTRPEKDFMRHFEISTFPVFDKYGNTLHVIEFKRDVTDEKRMLEQLIRSEKLASIGNMTAGVAHEMNNPLSGISGNASNLLRMPEKYGLNEKGISRITAILQAAARATTIMNDLLQLSRKPEQSSSMVNINTLIRKTTTAVRLDGSQDVERRFDFDEAVPLLYCDPSKIQQVIVHIVTNALQAIVDKKREQQENENYKGVLCISTQKQKEYVLITISDNGTGISPHHRNKIFDPFFSTRPAGQGTGLGLSISSKIIEEHGGKIYFDCIHNTTLFSITIPFERSNCSLHTIG